MQLRVHVLHGNMLHPLADLLTNHAHVCMLQMAGRLSRLGIRLLRNDNHADEHDGLRASGYRNSCRSTCVAPACKLTYRRHYCRLLHAPGYYERKFEAAAEWEAMQEAHRASSDGPDKAAPRQTQSSLSRSFGRAMLRAPSAILLESDQLDLCKAESTGAPNDTEAGKVQQIKQMWQMTRCRRRRGDQSRSVHSNPVSHSPVCAAQSQVAPSGSTNHGMPAHGMPAHASLELKRGAVLFVEASVCTHSIPVGLSLGMQGGNSFVSLFIAVIIHQLLEGLGVGAAAVEGQFSTSKLLVLSAGFALTAPAGIALGVGVHSVLSSHDPHLLMALGIVNAIAAGMLLFVSIQHMNALSNRGRWLRQQSVAAQLLVLASFCAGGAAMIAVGKWA